MTSYFSDHFDCPLCSKPMDYYPGPRPEEDACWSDGCFSSVLEGSYEPNLVQCHSCGAWIWYEDKDKKDDLAVSYFQIPDLEETAIDDFLVSLNKRAINTYNSWLESGLGDTEDREIYLRLRFWWAYNDILRKNLCHQKLKIRIKTFLHFRMLSATFREQKTIKKAAAICAENTQQNLQRLYELTSDKASVFSAEVQRALGKHKEAIVTLTKAQDSKEKAFPEWIENMFADQFEEDSNIKKKLIRLNKNNNKKLVELW